MSENGELARPIRSVLHPTDLTSANQLAFAHALRIARSASTRFYLLHVDPESEEEVDWGTFPAVRETLARWGLPAAEGAPEGTERSGVDVRKLQMHDRDPVHAILRFLDDHPVDLIILATHGRDGLPRWLHGSVAEPVARQGDTPTLFIPLGARGFVSPETGAVSLRKIVLPVDQHPQPQRAIQMALQVAQALGLGDLFVQVLHVGQGEAMPAVSASSGSVRLETALRTGNVVDQILAAASELDADMIVMATAGHQGFLDALRGSTTERVLRHAPCPVLAVPAA
ncbi:MAG: universal stress protein [Geminicoccaceae bacterium]